MSNKQYIEIDINTGEAIVGSDTSQDNTKNSVAPDNEVKSKKPEMVNKDSAAMKNEAAKRAHEFAMNAELSKKVEVLERKNKKLSVAVLVLGVILLISCIGLIIMMVKLGKKPAEKVVIKDGETVYVEQKTVKTATVIEKLDSEIKELSTEEAKISTTKIAGYEYLLVDVTMQTSGKNAKIYYRNEFEVDDNNEIVNDGLEKSYIECNHTRIPLDLSISEKINVLIPKVVNIAGEEAGLLFYGMDEKTNTPTNMTLYDMNVMKNMGSINFKETLYYYFICKQDEENDKVLILGADSTECYKYQTSDASFSKFVADGKYVLEFFDKFEFNFDADGILFKSYVRMGEHEYVGEYTMGIDFQENGINLAKTNFDAYVGFDYEDPGGDRIITPRENYIEEGTRTWGDRGGHYIVPMYEKLECDDYTPDGPYEIEKNESRWTYTNPTNGEKTTLGIDVSAFQENIDWDKVAADGVEFVILRAGYRGYSIGAIVEDEYFETNLKEALKHDLKVGIYIFSQAINEEEAKEEAEFLIEKVSRYKQFNGPIVFDTEQYDEPKDARANLISREERTKATKMFCETIKEAGYLPVVYANTKWMLFGIDMDELAEYPTWYAYYGNSPSLPYHFDIWQYSCEGRVDGINGNVDMNMMFTNVFGLGSAKE